MNVHERIWKTLSHEEPDRVPTFVQTIEPGFIEKYDAEFEIKGEPFMQGIELQVGKEIGLDSKWMHCGGYHADPSLMPELPTELKKKFKGKHIGTDGHVAETRVEDAKTSGGANWYVDGALQTPELIRAWISYMKTFKYPDTSYYKSLGNIWTDSISKDFLPIPTTLGPEYTAWAAIGLNSFAYIARKYPNDIADLFLAWAKVAIECQTRLFEVGIDIAFFCDDHCYKDRCMLSPPQFERFAYPAMKLMADNAHKHGAKLLMHSDGYLVEEMPFLIKAGIDAAEPLEYEANNRLSDIKAKYGDKIAFIGNVPASDALSYGTVEETVKLTKKCLADAAAGGGYICAPGSDVLTTVKPQNLKAMIETVKKYGVYPIKKNLQ
jgi:uroporphyrinogen decarboxylase